jgi:serine/threonine protein kinase
MAAEHRTRNDSQTPLHQACDELRQRILAGEDCRAESFFTTFPELVNDPQLAVALIYAEVLARQERNETVDNQELQARFPQWYELLLQRLSAGHVSGAEGVAGATPLSDTDPYSARAAPNPEAIPQLGPHELLEKIKEGGMGVVWRARDSVLGREVALKMIRASLVDGPESVWRFYREARAAARLHHPNIVPIHGMGMLNGKHCFTMPLLTGGSLATCKQQYTDRPRAAVELVEKVARAVHVAHEHGIIHRDLKPPNILLDATQVPMVADFGLAKITGAAGTEATLPGVRLGTPAYMSPEQAAGHSWEVSPATDVWALGIILFELLTGRKPFEGANCEAMTRAILTGEPPRLRQLRPDLDEDLETILSKCLRRPPRERYSSAAALADALHSWLCGALLPRVPQRKLPPWWRRRRALWIVLLIGALSVLCVWLAVKSSGLGTSPPRSFALLGPAGPLRAPRWFIKEGKWRMVEDQALLVESAKGGASLLELLEKVPWGRFRLNVEIQHVNPQVGTIGAYLFHVHQGVPPENDDWCMALTFEERIAAGRKDGLSEPRFSLYRIWSNGLGKSKVDLGPGAAVLEKLHPQPGAWHHFQFEITPETMHFFDPGVWPRPRNVDWALYRQRLLSHFSSERDTHLSVPERFTSNGGVGIIVIEGSALVRNFTIEALPAPNNRTDQEP